MKTGGYMGKILRVDLTNRSLIDEELDDEVLRSVLGGAGLGAKELYERTPRGIDSLHPASPLIFGTGPLTGTTCPGTGGWNVTCKGPLVSGFAVSSQAQGHFGARLKFAGYDGITIEGAADEWCYLVVHDGRAEIRDARHLVGRDAFETEDLLRSELNLPRASVISIGPAGENLTDLACIQGDKGHCAGNGGAGAVMGAKKLKAIVASGSQKVPVADPEKLRELIHTWAEAAQKSFIGELVHVGGTLGLQETIYKQGWLPIKNLTTNVFPEWERFTGETLRSDAAIERKRDGCHACPLNHCSRLRIKKGRHAGWEGQEPEYECMAQFGPNIGNTDLHEALVLAELNDRLGVNVNGAGFAISLAMECYEKELITKKDTDGLDLTWGNVEAVGTLLRKMATREGFGTVLADGPMKAAQRIGGDAPKFAVHCGKGNPPHGHDPRGDWPMLFSQAVTNNASVQGGGLIPVWEPNELVKREKYIAITCYLHDSALVCNFTDAGLRTLVSGINLVTGWDMSKEEANAVGERTMNLLRLFNMREGVTPKIEDISPRLREAPADGPNEGKTLAPLMDQMRRSYHQLMGWDEETGKPLPETLSRLNITEK